MTTKTLIRFCFVMAVLLITGSAAAQPIKRIPHIGFLSPATADQRRAEREMFWQGMRELGYVEGQNIAVEYRYANGQFAKLPELAAELAQLKVDVIVAHTTPGSVAAKRATSTIPIVMTNAGDPVASGLVASLARPGGNITGLSMLNVELGGKRLDILQEIVPGLGRVFVMWNPSNHGNAMIMKNTELVARALRLKLRSLEVKAPDELEAALKVISRGAGNALDVVEDPITIDQRQRIAQHAAKNSLPSIYGLGQYTDAGGLLSYGIHIEDLFHRAATYVDKILNGAKPADLPVEQPKKFELVINLKTAKQIGINIPQSVLYRADRVIR
jgi:putative ABC transport system substrate-binding protein